MLRFFRQIRQRLLTENRFSKYVLYAVGEIVLVVIGILIALGINNWNENRKDLEKERDYLISLRSEMERNLEQIHFQVGVNTRQSANARYILSVIAGDSLPDSSKQLAFALQEAPWFIPINITRDVWTELIATGNINLLRNTELKDKIAEFYSAIDFHLELEKECQTYYLGFRNGVAPLLDASAWVSLTEYLQNSEGANMDLSLVPAFRRSGQGLDIALPDPDKIRNDLLGIPELNGYLSDLISCREHGRRTFEGYRKHIESVLESLNRAINAG